MADSVSLRPFQYRGNRVWVVVDERGEPLVERGLVRLRYGAHKPREYRGRLGELTPTADGAVVSGPAGERADSTTKTPSKGGARSRSKAKKPRANEDWVGDKAVLAADGVVHLHTDGACSGNPGPMGIGGVLVVGDEEFEISEFLGRGTNNIAELTAILRGLQHPSMPAGAPIVLHTDSQYAIGVLAKSWKAKANQQLIAKLRRALDAHPQQLWHWVRGHAGEAHNERCDRLAVAAIHSR